MAVTGPVSKDVCSDFSLKNNIEVRGEGLGTKALLLVCDDAAG